MRIVTCNTIAMQRQPTVPDVRVDETRAYESAFSGLRVYLTIPDRHHDVIALRGGVLVFETESVACDGIVDGALYVLERQNPHSGMSWESWVSTEMADRSQRCEPRGPLRISREVVQMVKHHGAWHRRLASGFLDGPLYDWAAGLHLIGKVVGIYVPHVQSKE